MSSDTPTEDYIPEPGSTDFKQLNSEITSTLNKTISELLGKMLIDVDNHLFERAKSSEQAEDYDHFFNSMRMLRAERNNMGQRFAQSLSAHLKPYNQTDTSNTPDIILQAVSEKRQQAIVLLQDKADKLHETAINKLESQLLELSNHSRNSIHPKAITPKKFCDAYLASISGLELGEEIDDILFELFDTNFISQLDTIYKALTELLEHNGIHNPLDAQQSDELENTDDEVQDQEDVNKIINDFIHGDDEDKPRQSRSAPASKQFYGRDDVIQALTNLQLTYQPQHVDGEKTKVTTDDFTKSLLNSMAKLRPGTSMRSVAAIDAKTIEFVEMVFDAFLDDSNISNVIKNLLLRLQVPIIKIAMLDNKLFQNRNHPGRNVLDKIAHIGIGVEDIDNTLYQTLELIVQQLLQGYDKNIISFQTALNSLNRLHVNENENQSEKEKLTQKKILQEHARQIVLIELQYHVKNHYIPQSVQPLILKYWATLMLYRYLQHGNESHEWNESITLLKLLINSLQPIKDQQQWFNLNNSYQEICQRIEELLFETKQDQTKLTESVEILVRIFTEMLEQSEYKPDEPEFDESAFDTITLEQLTNQISSEATITPMQEEADQNRKKLTLLPRYVKPGGWYEIFVADDSAKRRLKLSVIIMEEARLVFVDRLGVKVLDKDAEIFAEELEQGKSAFLADDSIFDNALTRVIGSLSAKN
ncbi:MAG: DUF1631 domain-containing protein [Gammaproteobacteria bacterium]|nr:DUF1631 domain-containing protein [Gammaproteobacteria bacterium]